MVSKYKINHFGFIRLIFSLQVLFMHLENHLKFNLNFINQIFVFFPGVIGFFFISGFLVSGSYFRSNSNFIFLKKRFLRIFPGLFVCFIFTLSFLLKFGYFINDISDFLKYSFTQLTLFQFYTPNSLKNFALGNPNGNLWTISLEIQFYLILMTIFNFRYRLKILISLILLSLFLSFIYKEKIESSTLLFWKLLGVSFLVHFFYFGMGVITFLFWDRIKFLFIGNFFIYLFLYFLFIFIFRISPPFLPSNLVSLISSVLFIALIVSFSYSYPKLRFGYFEKNDYSYSIYLYHGILINLFYHYNLTTTFSNFIYFIIILFSLSFVSWNYIEKRFL